MWTVTGAVVAPRLPSHGFGASFGKEGEFGETRRAWLALNRKSCPEIASVYMKPPL